MNAENALLLIRVFEALLTAVELAPALRAKNERDVSLLKTLVAEDRGPTNEEIDSILGERDALTAQIRAIRDSKLA